METLTNIFLVCSSLGGFFVFFMVIGSIIIGIVNKFKEWQERRKIIIKIVDEFQNKKKVGE